MNGPYRLTATAVHNDLVADRLAGGSGQDLFFRSEDDVLSGNGKKEVVITGGP